MGFLFDSVLGRFFLLFRTNEFIDKKQEGIWLNVAPWHQIRKCDLSACIGLHNWVTEVCHLGICAFSCQFAFFMEIWALTCLIVLFESMYFYFRRGCQYINYVKWKCMSLKFLFKSSFDWFFASMPIHSFKFEFLGCKCMFLHVLRCIFVLVVY